MKELEVGIVGNGPSALLLSYILNGNIPYYDPSQFGPHPDSTLHHLLLDYIRIDSSSRSLLDAVTDPKVLAYVGSSYRSFYSASMLPINLLIDTLVSSDETNFASERFMQPRITWHKDANPIPHVVLGSSCKPGGQWSSNRPETDGLGERTLSYAEMISLPGFSFSQFFRQANGRSPEDYYRPNRQDMIDYLSEYPSAVGIAQNIKSGVIVTCVDKDIRGMFDIACLNKCKKNGQDPQFSYKVNRLVLATGISEIPSLGGANASFSDIVRMLTEQNGSYSYTVTPPLSTPPCEDPCTHGPCSTLVVGSGVSAAEAVNNCPPGSSIVHMYKWASNGQQFPCPLKRFPRELYPEYAAVYKMMKQGGVINDYEGFPNAQVLDVSPDGLIEIKLEDGSCVSRKVNQIKLRTGRTGSLEFLTHGIFDHEDMGHVSKQTLRRKMNGCEPNLEIEKNLFIVGSLTGDTLVRFLLGGCLWVAQSLYNTQRRGAVTNSND